MPINSPNPSQDDLREGEIWWRDHQAWIDESGYRLRSTRLMPGWAPSWVGKDVWPGSCEDNNLLPVTLQLHLLLRGLTSDFLHRLPRFKTRFGRKTKRKSCSRWSTPQHSLTKSILRRSFLQKNLKMCRKITVFPFWRSCGPQMTINTLSLSCLSYESVWILLSRLWERWLNFCDKFLR